MVYQAIGLMSGSSLDGLDIVLAEIQENGGKWRYEILQADCYVYSDEWINRLKNATLLTALDYQLLHVEYGHYLGRQVNRFIEENQLQYKVALIASHGHTTFHIPAKKMTAQLGDGSAIAATTQLPVVSDLRALDVAFGGQGAPIVPIGEKLLLGEYDYFLNLGGIANISVKPHPLQRESALTIPSDVKKSLQYSELQKTSSLFGKRDLGDAVFIAFDICTANRILNMLAADAGSEYDDEGKMAAAGNIDNTLLEKLNALDYYKQPSPKSLANDFGTGIVYPLIKDGGGSIADALRTYTEHIALQIKNAIMGLKNYKLKTTNPKLLATGGGAFNAFLVERVKDQLQELNIEVIVPEEKLVKYKEALIMALIGVLRWREEINVLASVTGAKRDSVGGAIWMGLAE